MAIQLALKTNMYFKEQIRIIGLSAMRANEIRKFLTKSLIKDDQVARIVGRSDKEPFDPKDK